MKYKLKEIVEATKGDYNGEFWTYFGTFLDQFYSEHTSNEERIKAVEEEPNFQGYEQWQKALIAASVNRLCDKYDIGNPEWVFKRVYFLDKPYFSMDTKNELRAFLIRESPVQYRMRNLFVFNNILNRC